LCERCNTSEAPQINLAIGVWFLALSHLKAGVIAERMGSYRPEEFTREECRKARALIAQIWALAENLQRPVALRPPWASQQQSPS
jgi:hypothetical protein